MCARHSSLSLTPQGTESLGLTQKLLGLVVYGALKFHLIFGYMNYIVYLCIVFRYNGRQNT